MTTQPFKGKARPMLEPGFNPEFAGLDAPSDDERRAAYLAKLQAADPEESEMVRVFKLIRRINENFAALAGAAMNWGRREMVITIDEGGKTVYAATLEIDSPAIEDKLRVVRLEIEQMQVAVLSGLKEKAA